MCGRYKAAVRVMSWCPPNGAGAAGARLKGISATAHSATVCPYGAAPLRVVIDPFDMTAETSPPLSDCER